MVESLFDLIGIDRIVPELAATTKKEALLELVAAIKPELRVKEIQDLYNIIRERENLGSTGIGEGVAIPHGKIKKLDMIEICFGRSSKGISYDAVDGKPVHLFFLMLAPESAASQYLLCLARLSRFLKNSQNRTLLLSAAGKEEIAEVLKRHE